jgi:FKBP-type peptidyl-prolyl cis-trans isomerase FklB
VRTLPNGLQYLVIAEGRPSSAGVHSHDIVTMNYRGTLLDGTEFVSSYKKRLG